MYSTFSAYTPSGVALQGMRTAGPGSGGHCAHTHTHTHTQTDTAIGLAVRSVWNARSRRWISFLIFHTFLPLFRSLSFSPSASLLPLPISAGSDKASQVVLLWQALLLWSKRLGAPNDTRAARSECRVRVYASVSASMSCSFLSTILPCVFWPNCCCIKL